MKKGYKNTTVYFRESHNEEYPFTILSNLLVNDERLSVTDKGIMLMILSNSDSYVLNVTYLQTKSGIGKDLFNKSMKNLQKHGYLLKKPKKSGGYKWIVIETCTIYSELRKIGYIKYDSEKSSWIIDENIERTMQKTDFHRNTDIQKPKKEKPKKEKPNIRKTENRKPVSQHITNNNNANTQSEKEQIKENKTENSTNVTLDSEVQNLGSDSDFKSDAGERNSPFQNSLPILFEKSEAFQSVLQQSGLKIEDFRLCSDSYLADVYLSMKLSKSDHVWAESLKHHNLNPKHYGLYAMAGRYALEEDFDTELRNQLTTQAKMSAQELLKRIYGY